jgi:hypothetical protein
MAAMGRQNLQLHGSTNISAQAGMMPPGVQDAGPWLGPGADASGLDAWLFAAPDYGPSHDSSTDGSSADGEVKPDPHWLSLLMRAKPWGAAAGSSSIAGSMVSRRAGRVQEASGAAGAENAASSIVPLPESSLSAESNSTVGRVGHRGLMRKVLRQRLAMSIQPERKLLLLLLLLLLLMMMMLGHCWMLLVQALAACDAASAA